MVYEKDGVPVKICTKCKIEKPISEFGVRRRAKDGYKARCRKCTNEYRMPSESEIKRNARSRDRKYKFESGEYDRMLREQNGVCSVCREPETRKSPRSHAVLNLLVDHSHVTNKVRSLLCHRCNTAIGLFRDSPLLCSAAAMYLERFS